MGSVLASDNLIQNITNQRASIQELYTSFEHFNVNSYTQKKIQEAVDTEKFSELLRNQSPNREKARLQSPFSSIRRMACGTSSCCLRSPSQSL